MPFTENEILDLSIAGEIGDDDARQIITEIREGRQIIRRPDGSFQRLETAPAAPSEQVPGAEPAPAAEPAPVIEAPVAEPAPAPTAAAPEPAGIPVATPQTRQFDGDFTEAERDANEILDLDPNIKTRGELLPFGRNAEGDLVFAVPEIALTLARSVLLPGQAIRGVPIVPEDVTRMAVDVAGPGARSLIGLKKVSKLTAKQIAEAPTSLDLTAASGKKFKASRQSGARLSPDDYVGFLAGAERDLVEEGIDAGLHPKLTAVFNALTKKIGSAMDAKELHKIRRTIGIATESRERDEARIARILRDSFDDFVENLPGTPEWVKARGLYIQARKAETMEEAINRAGNAASGLENGLRIEFTKLLNNARKIRGFSREERAAMQAIVDGDFTTNTLKKIGKFGLGSGRQSTAIGATIGAVTGASVAGAPGTAAALLGATAAQKGAERNTLRAAETLRALIAGARPEPAQRIEGTATRTLGGAAVAPLIENEEEGAI